MKKYIVTKDFKSPYVVSTGMGHNPQRIQYKTFRKGQIISGQMQTSNGKPAFLMVNGVLPVDLNYIKEVVTKDFDEPKSNASGKETSIEKKLSIGGGSNNPQIKYVDGFLLGSAVGYLAVVAMTKYGYLTNVTTKFKIYGTLAGGLLSAYLVYRNNSSKVSKNIEITSKK